MENKQILSQLNVAQWLGTYIKEMQEVDYESNFMMDKSIKLINEVITDLESGIAYSNELYKAQEEITIEQRRSKSFLECLKEEEQKNLDLARINMDLEKSLKDRESRLDSIMGLANDCNYED